MHFFQEPDPPLQDLSTSPYVQIKLPLTQMVSQQIWAAICLQLFQHFLPTVFTCQTSAKSVRMLCMELMHSRFSRICRRCLSLHELLFLEWIAQIKTQNTTLLTEFNLCAYLSFSCLGLQACDTTFISLGMFVRRTSPVYTTRKQSRFLIYCPVC